MMAEVGQATASPGIHKRVCAAFVDMVIGNLLSIVFLVLLPIAGRWLVLSLWLLVRDLLGRSPGKVCVGLAIENRERGKPDRIQLLVRNITMAIPLLPLVEYVMVRMSPQGLRLGDQWGRTRVIDLKPERADGPFLWYGLGLLVLFFMLCMLLAFAFLSSTRMTTGTSP